MSRTYLDWNATAPLRPEAKAAMVEAMELVGNPSSVHAEGRAAKAVIEKARRQIADAFGASSAEIVFTSGATEASALALRTRDLESSLIEHDCVNAWTDAVLGCDTNGLVKVVHPENSALQIANGETGVIQSLPEGLAVCDFVQGFGKLPIGFDWTGVDMGLVSAHKFGGPKGIGALLVKQGLDLHVQIRGGGQEMGRRAGTENLVGIAGFGAAAAAAIRDLNDGVWEPVAALRDLLEERLMSESPELVIFGKDVKRLPNTSYFALPGWTGETQVIQMDLAGYAVSAGAACSSGKVKASGVLLAMGVDELTASSTLRVSLGATTTKDEVMGFADTWLTEYRRHCERAA